MEKKYLTVTQCITLMPPHSHWLFHMNKESVMALYNRFLNTLALQPLLPSFLWGMVWLTWGAGHCSRHRHWANPRTSGFIAFTWIFICWRFLDTAQQQAHSELLVPTTVKQNQHFHWFCLPGLSYSCSAFLNQRYSILPEQHELCVTSLFCWNRIPFNSYVQQFAAYTLTDIARAFREAPSKKMQNHRTRLVG